MLAIALVQKGVKFIDGDIVADDSYFAFETLRRRLSQDDLVWADGRARLCFDNYDNVVFVNILPADRPGEIGLCHVTPFADTTGSTNGSSRLPRARDASFSSTASRGSDSSHALGQHAAR